jgi:hypothetical protein
LDTGKGICCGMRATPNVYIEEERRNERITELERINAVKDMMLHTTTNQ